MKKLALCALALLAVTSLALAGEKLPQDGSFDVFSGGQRIGTVEVGSLIFTFYDDPETNHPPNRTVSTWGWDNENGRYSNGGEHTAEFVDIGSGCYSWEKKDADGNVIDSGTICPPNPS